MRILFPQGCSAGVSPAFLICADIRKIAGGTPALRNCFGHFRGAMDGAANSWIRPAAADISRHGSINVVVRRVGSFFEQGHRAHDLAGLAIATLRHFNFEPRALYRVISVRRESFDGGDLFSCGAR